MKTEVDLLCVFVDSSKLLKIQEIGLKGLKVPQTHIRTYYTIQEHIKNSSDDLYFNLKAKSQKTA